MPARQLDLLKGKRQRGTVAPKPSEFAIHCMVVETFWRWRNRSWQMWHIPLGEKRDAKTAAKLKRMGVRPGLPDFLLIDPTGVHHWLELKASKGKVSLEQREFLAAMANAHVPSAIVHSYAEAIDQLKAWGAVRSVVVMA